MSRQMAAAGDEPAGRRRPRTVTTELQCWTSSFPDDLLAIIYRMLASSPRGRVRFAAVCRSWRSAARTVPPAAAPLPWLLLSPCDSDVTKRLHCPEDGAVVSVPLPGRTWLVGCHDGGWAISYLMPDGFRIVNLFSGAQVSLSEKQRRMVFAATAGLRHDIAMKVVCSQQPTATGCVLAAITGTCGVALCRIGCPDDDDQGWVAQGFPGLHDIAFCNNGDLYGMHYNGTLVKLEIHEDATLAERPIAGDCPTGEQYYYRDYASYIFDLKGNIAVAIRAIWSPQQVVEPFFKLFELVDIIHHAGEQQMTTQQHYYKKKWSEVTSLGDHALFLGKTGASKVVYVSADTPPDYGVKRNHIYYSNSSCSLDSDGFVPNDALFLAISNNDGHQTYYKDEDNVVNNLNVSTYIRSTGYFMNYGPSGGMWILPPNI